jgi:hypothetical protein
MAVVVTMRHPSHRNSDAMWSPVPCLFRQTLISTAKRCEPVHTGIPAQRQDRRFRDQRQKFELCDLDILFNGDQCGSSRLRFHDLQKFGFAVGYAAAGPGWMPRWLNRVAMSVRRCS